MRAPDRFRVNPFCAALATLATLPLAGSAWAQAAAPAETARPAAVVEVTAQKVSENPQKVPLAITAIGGDEIAATGTLNATALRSQVTGLAVVEQGPGASIQIRGVGSNPGGGNIDPSVALGIDGVYQSRASSAFGAFYDLERVEVLKGPQGTLYGRNATVGAVNVISRKPSNRTEGELTFELGNYGLVRGAGMVNGKISDTLKFRVAGQAVRRDGYLSDGYNDANDEAARAKLLWEPSSNFSLLFTGDVHKKAGNGQGTIFTGTAENRNANGTPFVPATFGPPTFQGVPRDRWDNTSLQIHTPARDATGDAWTLAPIVLSANPNAPTQGLNDPLQRGTGHAEAPNQGLKIRNSGLSLEANYSFGDKAPTLTVIGASRESYVLNQSFTGGNLVVPAYSLVDQKQRSFEARLASAPGVLRWIAGAFYMSEDAPTLLVNRALPSPATGIPLGAATYIDMTTVNAVTKAVFGQATWSATDALRLTAGLRYTKDDKHQQGLLLCRAVMAVDKSGVKCPTSFWPAYNNAQIPVDTSFADSAVNYKVGADFDLAKDAMLYASVSTGYKAGGLNFMPDNGLASSRAKFAPETLTALAAGFKSKLMQGKLQLNAELFHWTYKDQQVAEIDQFDPTASGVLSPVTQVLFINNPGPSKIYGLDLDLVFSPTNNNRITASLALLHARNGKFVLNHTKTTQPVNASGGTATFPLEAATDVSGKVMPFSPTVQLNLGYQHYFDLANGAVVTAGFDGQYQSSNYVNYHLFSPEYQKAFFRGNLNLGYTTANGKLNINAWLRNFTNVAVITRGAVGGGSNGVAAGHYANIADPRTFGVTTTLKF